MTDHDLAMWRAKRDLRVAALVTSTAEQAMAALAKHGHTLAYFDELSRILRDAEAERQAILAAPPPWVVERAQGAQGPTA